MWDSKAGSPRAKARLRAEAGSRALSILRVIEAEYLVTCDRIPHSPPSADGRFFVYNQIMEYFNVTEKEVEDKMFNIFSY